MLEYLLTALSEFTFALHISTNSFYYIFVTFQPQQMEGGRLEPYSKFCLPRPGCILHYTIIVKPEEQMMRTGILMS